MPPAENVIEIHLRGAEQLFNSLDPSPFHERDLDDDAERYIIASARELRGKGPLRLIVTLPEAACKTPTAQHIPDGIRHYFAYRAKQTRQDLSELLRIGRRFLVIGLAVLALCFAVIQFLNQRGPLFAMQPLVEQSLLILGWVANWRPLEIFLYDWIPLYRQIALLRRLAAMQVEVRALVQPMTA